MDMGFNTSHAFEANDSAQGLRPVGWSELRARLAAAQDLRRTGIPADTARDALSGGASFHHPAALLLLQDEWSERAQVEEGVNPYSSARGNHGDGKQGGIQNTPPNSSRAELIRRELP